MITGSQPVSKAGAAIAVVGSNPILAAISTEKTEYSGENPPGLVKASADSAVKVFCVLCARI